LLLLARRLATSYVGVWRDSFPVLHVERFARMSREQRAAKVAADSVRLAGNAALGAKGADVAMTLWREALRRAAAIRDTHGMAATVGNLGAGFYRMSELDSAEAYLVRAQELARSIGDNRTAGNALGTLANVARDRGDLRR